MKLTSIQALVIKGGIYHCTWDTSQALYLPFGSFLVERSMVADNIGVRIKFLFADKGFAKAIQDMRVQKELAQLDVSGLEEMLRAAEPALALA